MFGRPSFGVSQPNTFGFGNTASTSFGQPNQLFGNSNNTFGSGSSGFGSTSQPIFGSPPQSSAPLFGSTTAPAFGQSGQSSGFGPLFGNTQQPSSSGATFGSSTSTGFGQQSKSTGFGFPSSGLFGQNTQTQQNAPSMFQSSSTAPLFGGSTTFGATQAPLGTVNKFIPVTGTDSVQKAGAVQSINTKHHCITCMKEYENKSLEELRWEDYQANRKGPQQQSSFGGPSQPFGIASTNSTLFGQTENKPAFGQSSTAFGQPSFGISSQTTASNMFGKSSTGFGNTSTTNSFAFGTGTPTTGLFGSSTASKPFAAPTNQPLFGSTQQQQSNFGSNLFSQPSTQSTTSNLFGKPNQQGFNMGQSTFQFGTQPQTQSNLFQNPKSSTGFNLFNQPNTTTSTFGQPQQQSTFTPFGNFGKSTQPTFGQTTQSTFGTGLQTSFGNTSKSLFAPSTNLFGNNFQSNAGFNLQTQQQQQPMLNLQANETQFQDARPFLSVDAYGYHPHLDGLSPMKSHIPAYTTNPKELQKYLEAPQPIAVVTPITKRIKVMPPTMKKVNLFEDSVDHKTTEINFTLKQSAKRLVIRKNNFYVNNNNNSDENDESVNVEIEGQRKLTPTLSSITAKGPPLFMEAVRFRRPTEFDEYSSSGISFEYEKSSSTTEISQSNTSTLTTDDSGTTIATITLNPKTSSTSISSTTSDTSKTSDTSTTSNTSDATITITIEDDDYYEPIKSKNPPPPPPPIDTCGIILTRAEYYTVPPLDKLVEHKLGDGQCLVKGFTIGRVGYGNVSFPDLMDIANLNLDQLVHFRYRELTIYPDDTKKPPLGQGLNRRAQVTLDRVYPKGKVDRKLITNVNTLTSINFAETLRNLCDKHGTKFLDYRPETGSWVFMVDHFSKYGYSDTDDEETSNVGIQTKQIKENEKLEDDASKETKTKKKKQPSKKAEEESFDEEFVEQPIEEIIIDDDDDLMIDDGTLQSESAAAYDVSDTGESEDIDVDFPIKLSESLHQVKTRRDLYKTTGEKIFLMKATLFEDEEVVPVNIENDNIETLSTTDMLLKEYVKPISIKRKTLKLDRQKPRAFTLDNKSCTVPMNKSLYNCRNYMDMAIFKGRSFKVGWGKGLILATTCNSVDPSNSFNIKTTVEVMDVSNLTNYNPLLDSIPAHLQIILEMSEVKLSDGIPSFSVHNTKSALARHQYLANETYLKAVSNRDVLYYKEIWDLIVALWGDISDDQSRREQLSKWFQNVLMKNVEEDIYTLYRTGKHNVFEMIFVYLTGNQLMKAAELALRNNLPNLSLLISQTNLSTSAKPILQNQIEQWETSLALDNMDIAVQKIYMLLSGLVINNDNDNDTNKHINLVNIFENLNWKQCAAAILWYVTPSAQPISAIVDLYKKAFDEDYLAQRPIPEHMDDSSDIFDIQYHLLLLFCNRGNSLEEILNPLTHSNYGGDYRLSWMLLQILTALNVGIINDNAKDVITTSFSIQLESLGLTKWAVFVLLFIKDPYLCKNLVMGCMHRNLTSSSSDAVENALVRDLCIPPQWIHEVKSYKTELLNMHWQSYRHLSYTKLWHESHRIAVESIVPDLIVNEKFDIVRAILENLEQGQMRIPNWKSQGGLLLDFLKIIHIFNESDEDINRDDAMAIHRGLLDICTRMPLYPKYTSSQIAALSELSKRCYIYVKLLLKYINPTYEGIITLTNLEIDRLVMPADYIFQEMSNEGFLMQIE